MKEVLSQILSDYLSDTYGIQKEMLEFTTPPKKSWADLALACFSLAKSLRKSPQIIAENLAIEIQNIPKMKKICSSCKHEWWYVNFVFSSESIETSFVDFCKKGYYHQSEQETIIIDYIGANVGKPLHIGHICTPSQWQVLINAFRKQGHRVIADSHIGDWGIIFWKLLVAYKKYGKQDKLKENAVDHLFQLYVKISIEAENNLVSESEFREAFRMLSQGDSASKELWSEFTKHSIYSMRESLAQIGVTPDYDIGESFYEGIGLEKMQDYPDLQYSMKDIVDELLEKKVATKNDDHSVGVVFPDEENIPSCILQKRDGTHGYLASDLACIKYRMTNWNPQRIIYFVDVRQQLHFRQVFYIAKKAWWISKDTELTHAHNGFVSLKDGAMSTRKGKIIPLRDVLKEAESRASHIISQKRSDISQGDRERLSRIVWIGAIKYGYLKKSRTSDSVFDWDEFLSFEGNSGPYIQYAYVRACKILAWKPSISRETISLQENSEKHLAQQLMNFSDVFQELTDNYYPHILCQYCYDIAKAFSLMYNDLPILHENNKTIKESRLFLIDIFREILEECFEILAIELPEEM